MTLFPIPLPSLLLPHKIRASGAWLPREVSFQLLHRRENWIDIFVDTISPDDADVHKHFQDTSDTTIVMDSGGGANEKGRVKVDSLKVEEAREQSQEQNKGAFRLYFAWTIAEGLIMVSRVTRVLHDVLQPVFKYHHDCT